jgi:hypothetical protein
VPVYPEKEISRRGESFQGFDLMTRPVEAMIKRNKIKCSTYSPTGVEYTSEHICVEVGSSSRGSHGTLSRIGDNEWALIPIVPQLPAPVTGDTGLVAEGVRGHCRRRFGEQHNGKIGFLASFFIQQAANNKGEVVLVGMRVSNGLWVS